MRDLTHPALMYVKGLLFLAIGSISATLLVLDRPTIRIALLLALSIWSFARAYYFVFYVIERYIDPGYRFAGLIDFMRYLLRRNGKRDGGG